MNKNKIKYALFCIGVGVAAACSLILLFVLLLNLNGRNVILYEANSGLALFEMAILILSVATCFASSEIYYEYLQSKMRRKRYST